MDKIKQLVLWAMIFVAASILLILALTGRLAIASSIAFLPDNVAYIGGQ